MSNLLQTMHQVCLRPVGPVCFVSHNTNRLKEELPKLYIRFHQLLKTAMNKI